MAKKSTVKSLPKEFRKTVRLNPDEEKAFQSIVSNLSFGTENQVFKYLIKTHDSRLRGLKFQESEIEKLKFELESKVHQLQEIQDSFKLISNFVKLKL